MGQIAKPKLSRRTLMITLGKIILGGGLNAVGIRLFLIPNDMVIGGVSGLATIIHYLSGWPAGLLIALLNAPIFLLGFLFLGRRLTLTSLVGVLTTSLLVDVLAPLNIVVTTTPLLVAVYGGLFVGLGCGILLAAGSSSGGTDFSARILEHFRPNVSIGAWILVLDVFVILLGVLVWGEIEMALYAGIAVFILIRIVDFFVYRTRKQTQKMEVD
ncbi:MAG: YitT family protein [Oscillospiraceae bacterium]|nr:YitT family protein [Oscillospiraceae bacterium]